MISKTLNAFFLKLHFSNRAVTPRNLYRFIWNFDCSFKIIFFYRITYGFFILL